MSANNQSQTQMPNRPIFFIDLAVKKPKRDATRFMFSAALMRRPSLPNRGCPMKGRLQLNWFLPIVFVN